MYCCQGFANHVAAAGSRGIALLVESGSSGIGIILQSRGVSFADQGRAETIGGDVTINIATDVGVRYCPWCGWHLEQLIAAAPEAFAELAKRHEGLAAVTSP